MKINIKKIRKLYFIEISLIHNPALCSLCSILLILMANYSFNCWFSAINYCYLVAICIWQAYHPKVTPAENPSIRQATGCETIFFMSYNKPIFIDQVII
jgi:hypothetical protein